jgi:hypothetical protein
LLPSDDINQEEIMSRHQPTTPLTPPPSSSSSSTSAFSSTSAPVSLRRQSLSSPSLGVEDKSSSAKAPIDQRKCALFVKVLKGEFLEELKYLWEVANRRAQPRDTFAHQVLVPLQALSSLGPSGVETLVTGVSQVTEFLVNQQRDEQISLIADLQHELDLARLEILMEVVAREALHRYEDFIVNRLHDDPRQGVIPFAKVGARRMIEFLLRQGKKNSLGHVEVRLNEAVLLVGLIEGRSGMGIEGFSNNELCLKAHKKSLLARKSQPKTLDAEDVYGRAAFRYGMVKDGKMTETKLYSREKPKHTEFSDWKEKTSAVLKGKVRPGGFGYVRLNKKGDPKAGFVDMPLAVIVDRYDYRPQEMKSFTPLLQAELLSYSPRYVRVDKATVEKYLRWRQQGHLTQSLVEYVREVIKVPKVQWVICCGEDLSELTLAGANFSHTDFSGSILSGDLTGVNFSDSYLIGVQLKEVICAHQMNLCNAHCEYLQAEGVDFKGSDFSHTHFDYARLKKANIIGCELLGASWKNADISDISSDTELLREQKRRHSVLAAEVKVQHEQYTALKTQFDAIQKNQQTLDNRLQGQEEKQQEILLARMAEALRASGGLKGISLENWNKVKAHWETRVKVSETEGFSALSLMTDYLTSQQKAAASDPDLQQALQQLAKTWTESHHTVERTQQSRDRLARRTRRLSLFCESQLRLESACQDEVKTLQLKLDGAQEDVKTVQGLQHRLQAVEADFQSLRSAGDWQQSLRQFREDCDSELKALGQSQAEEITRLTGEICSQCETQFVQQSQRLTDLGKQLRELDVEFAYRLERLEKRLDAMDTWAEEVKRTLIAQDEKAKGAQGMTKELESAVKELQAAHERQRKEQLLQIKEIADLKSRLTEASDVEHLKALTGEFKKFTKESKYDHSDASTIESLQRVFQNMQDQLTAEQKKWEEKIQNATLPSVRRKFEQALEKGKVQSRHVAQLQEQLQSSWKDYRAAQEEVLLKLRQDVESVIAEHGNRLKALEVDVGELKSWAKETQERLRFLESDAGPMQQKIQQLQLRMEEWMKQVAEGHSPPVPLSPAALEEIKTDCQKQKQNGEEARGELGDEDGEIAKDLARVEEKLKVLETIERSLKDLTPRMERVESEVKSVQHELADTRQQLKRSDPSYTVAKRLLLLRAIMLDLLKEEKSRPEDISERQLNQGLKCGEEISQGLDCYIAPNGREDSHSSLVTPLQGWVEREFLDGTTRVLLLQGPGGSGKSTFNSHLMQQLWSVDAWKSFKPGDPAPEKAWVPFFISLGSDRINPREELFKTLKALPELIEDFTEEEINVLKKEYRILWIADAYDEMAGNLKVNLYDINALDQYDGRVKLLVSHRSDSAPELTKADEMTYFMPKGGRDRASMSLYRSFQVAPFSGEQIDAYIVEYLKKHRDNEWKDVDYQRQLRRIPHIESLVSTPFLLYVAVSSLPAIIQQVEAEEKLKSLSSSSPTTSPEELKIAMTGKLLLDEFVQGWFSRQIDKAYQNKTFLKDPGAIITDDTVEQYRKKDEYKYQERCLRRAYAVFCMEFAHDLSQENRTSVIYPPEQKREGLGRHSQSTLSSPLSPKPETPGWVKELFNDSDDMKLCRQGTPLRTRTLTGTSVQFEFIHALLIPYFSSVYECEYQESKAPSTLPPAPLLPPPVQMSAPLSSPAAPLSGGRGGARPPLSLGIRPHLPLPGPIGGIGPRPPGVPKPLSGAFPQTLLGSPSGVRGQSPSAPSPGGRGSQPSPPSSLSSTILKPPG